MVREDILADMPEYWRECIERYNREGKCGSVMFSTVEFIPFLCKLLAAVEPEDEPVRLAKAPLKDIKSLSDLLPEEPVTKPVKEIDVEVERLNKEKEEAVANKDFEKAASLRDQADNLRKKKTIIPKSFHPEINLQIESETIKAKTRFLPPDWSEGYDRPTGDP